MRTRSRARSRPPLTSCRQARASPEARPPRLRQGRARALLRVLQPSRELPDCAGDRQGDAMTELLQGTAGRSPRQAVAAVRGTCRRWRCSPPSAMRFLAAADPRLRPQPPRFRTPLRTRTDSRSAPPTQETAVAETTNGVAEQRKGAAHDPFKPLPGSEKEEAELHELELLEIKLHWLGFHRLSSTGSSENRKPAAANPKQRTD